MEERGFHSHEKKLITGISLVMGLRMLGISMIIPVFSIFATELPGSTPTLAGLAVGTFGIVQIALLVPFGRLSDRWGRKQVTLLGLGVYLAGMILSGLSKSIQQLIGARVLAGAGAINGVTMAWLTEGVPAHKRSAALSYVGIAMGLSVIFGFTLSPIIAAKAGIPVLFYLCASLISVTMLYTIFQLKNHESGIEEHIEISGNGVLAALKNRDLARLNAAGFVGNLGLSMVFFVLPLLFHRSIGLEAMWKIYVPISLAGTACMFYFGKKADRYGTTPVTILGLASEAAGVLCAVIGESTAGLFVAFLLFYMGHCIMAPVLPAAVSHYPNQRLKGTVMSIFNSFQFLGSGIGGVLGGAIFELDYRYAFIGLALMLAGSIMYMRPYAAFARHPARA
ncbi:MAG: MFS transporter [Spirochaetes bacterium]|nr:MAG: MFS transporter [Spirochaetota bacterium]